MYFKPDLDEANTYKWMNNLLQWVRMVSPYWIRFKTKGLLRSEVKLSQVNPAAIV